MVATSRVTQYEFSNRASQAAVLPARGCDARKCIKLWRPLGGYSSKIERNVKMTKRSYYKVPKKVSEMTEEELEAFASAIYDNMMAKFAEELSTEETDNG